MFRRLMKKYPSTIFGFSTGKVMSLATAASLFLPIELGLVSIEPALVSTAARLPVPTLELWYADDWNRACYGRSEKGSAPTFVPSLKKHARLKRRAPKRLFAGHALRGRKRNGRLDQLWNEVDHEALHALNLSSPLIQFANRALNEVPLDYDPTLRLVGGLNTEIAPVEIARYEETVGVYKPNDFPELKKQLAELRVQAKQIDREVFQASQEKLREPTLVAAVASPKAVLSHDERLPESVSSPAAPQFAAAVVTQPVTTQAAVEPRLIVPTLAEKRWVAKPQLAAAAPTPGLLANRRASAATMAAGGVVEGTALGDLDIDDDVLDWLEEKKGHIELYLQPNRSRDPQDIVFLSYQYPDERFQIDLRGLEGQYRLLASLFAKNDKTPVAQVVHPQLISAEVYKKQIHFRISRAVINQMSARKITHVGGVLLTATVFEGAAGDYRSPTPVAGAVVTLVGLGEQGAHQTDAEGNIRLERVPAHSELLVQITAPGYHPTSVIVPTFDGDVYAPLYLLSRKTGYFIPGGQDPANSVVLGRVFDPVTRTPMPEQQFGLSFRTEPPLYFGSLPDPSLKSTSKAGLFAFFNLAPSFRALNRLGVSARSILYNMLPDFGYYVELGRGGKGRLRAELFDPLRDQPPAAKISVVGEPGFAVETNSGGRFEIPNIDLPPSLITLEVESEDYPRTWHSIPWNIRNQNQVRRLYMMENQLIQDGAASAARVAVQSGKGSIVGGAEAPFFKGIKQCVTVFLVDSQGQVMARENGPFPLHQAPLDNKALCLSKEDPGFSFFNIPPGEYLLKWVSGKGFAFRTHVVRVGKDRVSVVVN